MLTGVILAGGQSRRMGGKPKALLPFYDECLIERQIRIMKRVCTELIVVTNNLQMPAIQPMLEDSMVRLMTDDTPYQGPLGGMYTGFSGSANEDIWLVGCDMPFVSASAATLMQQRKREWNCEAVIPEVGGKLHPLHGIYDRQCVRIISKMLTAGERRVQELFNRIDYRKIDETFIMEQGLDHRFVANMNTPEEYQQALANGVRREIDLDQ